jgi:hypothetical protein
MNRKIHLLLISFLALINAIVSAPLFLIFIDTTLNGAETNAPMFNSGAEGIFALLTASMWSIVLLGLVGITVSSYLFFQTVQKETLSRSTLKSIFLFGLVFMLSYVFSILAAMVYSFG